MENTNLKNIAIYVRVAPGGPPENEQLDVVLSYLNSYPETKISVYTDHKDSREAFNSLKHDLKQSLFQEIICWRFDRLDTVAESIEDTFHFFQFLEEVNTRFTSVDDKFFSINTTNIFTEVLKMTTQAKANLRVERVKTSLTEALNAGRHIGRPVSINREKVILLRSQGHSIRKIASSMGISTSSVQIALKQ